MPSSRGNIGSTFVAIRLHRLTKCKDYLLAQCHQIGAPLSNTNLRCSVISSAGRACSSDGKIVARALPVRKHPPHLHPVPGDGVRCYLGRANLRRDVTPQP